MPPLPPAMPLPAQAPAEGAPLRDSALADALGGLASATRLAVLRQLRTPKALRDIEVRAPGPEGGEVRPISRQAVREHLDKLLDIGVIHARESERPYGPTLEYVLDHQALFALAEEFRGLARLRPVEEPVGATVQGDAAALPAELRGPCLVLVKGLDEGRSWPLPPPVSGTRDWVIGRRRDAPVALDFDPYVSSENASVGWNGTSHAVLDLPDSRNGTTLNFRRLPKGVAHPLRHGDVVGVGRCLLLFRA